MVGSASLGGDRSTTPPTARRCLFRGRPLLSAPIGPNATRRLARLRAVTLSQQAPERQADLQTAPVELGVKYRWAVGALCSVPVVGLALPLGVAPVGLAAISGGLGRIPRPVRALVVAATLGIVAYVMGWVARGGPFPVSGVGQFGVAALLLAGFGRLAPDADRAAHLLMTVGVANVAYYLVSTQDNISDVQSLWKFGIAYPAIFAVVYVACERQGRWAAIVGLFVFGVASLALDYRSAGVVCFLAAAVSMAAPAATGRRLWRRGSARLLGFGVLAATGLAFAVPRLIERGWFGSVVRDRTAAQSQAGTLLFGGRKEPPLSMAAIRERPLTGWGSAQNIDQATIAEGVRLAQGPFRMGPSHTFMPIWVRRDGQVSLHSILFNSWVEGASSLRCSLQGWSRSHSLRSVDVAGDGPHS